MEWRMWEKFLGTKKKINQSTNPGHTLWKGRIHSILWHIDRWFGGCVNIEWEGNSLWIQAVETVWEELFNSWPGIDSSAFCLKELEALFVWCALQDIYWSQEPQIYFYTEGEDKYLQTMIEQSKETDQSNFSIKDDGSLWYNSRLCVPDNLNLKKKIMKEAHSIPYTAHLGSTKMYQDLKTIYWWINMKREVTEYVF